MKKNWRLYLKLILFIIFCEFLTNINFAANNISDLHSTTLRSQPGFFHFSFDNIKMPAGINHAGLLGIIYNLDLTQKFYGGVGGYGGVTGSQGGFFVLGFNGGAHYEFFPHWFLDASFFAGGGGGRSSLVGGGLMLRPAIGLLYDASFMRVGLHYSDIHFPEGKIHSHQVGVDFDIPCAIAYVSPQQNNLNVFSTKEINLFAKNYLNISYNDFALFLQIYKQKKGTKNVLGLVQDGTIGLVGAELDHYISPAIFSWIKTSGAFRGIPNGYMDVLGGIGYKLFFNNSNIALVSQMGIGAGGGGNVDTGGGILVNPQIGIQWPLTTFLDARLSGGYIFAPFGKLKGVTALGEILYHLDVAIPTVRKIIPEITTEFYRKNWQIELFNQTYVHPQRTYLDVKPAIQLIGLQINQIISPHLFLIYQAASAYHGKNSGGLATGMIGVGAKTPQMLNERINFFGEVLAGAAGGGSLAVSGGSILETILGVHYKFNSYLGLETSIGKLKALRDKLNTPIVNIGITLEFGTLSAKTNELFKRTDRF